MAMIDALGFFGLFVNLTSMAMKDIFYLKFLSLAANSIYIIYGVLIEVIPIIVGSVIAVGIHAVRIYKLNQNKKFNLMNLNRNE